TPLLLRLGLASSLTKVSTQFLLGLLLLGCHLRQLLLTPPMHNFSAASSRSPFLFGASESILPNEVCNFYDSTTGSLFI
ncbi:hypothetical protein K438DRAFT_1870437, partial [Mycena galopus ATCC 62051]